MSSERKPDPTPGMSLIVKTVTRWLKGFLLLYGIFIVFYGHLTPGGGFAGGVILACCFVLLTLAEGQRTAMKTLSKNAASELDSLGLLLFLALGFVGLLEGAAFLKNFIPTPVAAWFNLVSGGFMPLANIAIGLKVGASLFVIFSVLAALKATEKKEDEVPK